MGPIRNEGWAIILSDGPGSKLLSLTASNLAYEN